jgi:hypothetical protein
MNRFPKDFMFQLSREEAEALRSQIATLESGRGQHRKYLPNDFTEHGILMLSSVLGSERAVQVNIVIMRTFIRLRRLVASHAELTQKLRRNTPLPSSVASLSSTGSCSRNHPPKGLTRVRRFRRRSA